MAGLRVEVRAGFGLLAAGLALCAAVAVVFGLRLADLDDARARAGADAVGRVERVDAGRGATVLVAWTDAGGVRHRQRFPLTDTDRYRPGDNYPLHYDPAAPSPSALPAAAEDLADRRDEDLVPLVLAVVGGIALCLFWTTRAALHLVTRRAPARQGRARVGLAPTGRSSRPVVHVQWQLASGRPREGWQPVMSGPAEAALRAAAGSDAAGGARVTVHQRRLGGRVVLVLPDGTSLVPTGRLRSREPRGWTDAPDPPPVTDAPLPRGWQLRCAAAGTALGAVGALAGWHLTGRTEATVAIALAVAAFTVTGAWLREMLHAT
ncbi:DUF3592 domain-containing protein [Streptomyces sp. NRRL B-24484]|uniref:DUF3592 domain-containing protein n=1 Tax=Streptomyces sp. NRRL B-24484 TaxID=1463833 RepID=UPI0004BFD851|nr:DUF3592 domain-containing protein [Streptomyces sp. NRRL B-24484]